MENLPPTNLPSEPQAIPASAPKTSATSTNSIVALVLGILSILCCGFFCGIPAIFLGKSELKAVDEGRISEENRVLAKIGMILGIVGTALSCIGSLIYLVLFALGISTGMMHELP